MRRPAFSDRLVKRVFVDGGRFLHVVRVDDNVFLLEPELSLFLFDRVCAFGQNLKKWRQEWNPPLIGYCTMVENGKKHRQNSNLIIHCPTSEGANE